MGWKHYQTVDPPTLLKRERERTPGWKGTVWCKSTNSSLQILIFQIHQISDISYFPQFNLSHEKIPLSPNAQKSPKKST